MKPVAKAQAELQSKIKMEKAKQDEETKKVADSLQSLESSINSTTGAST